MSLMGTPGKAALTVFTVSVTVEESSGTVGFQWAVNSLDAQIGLHKADGQLLCILSPGTY